MVFDLDKAIEDEEEFQRALRDILVRSETRLKSYRLSRSFMRGESPPQEGEPPLTIPAAAELILRKHGSLHVREIAKYLEDYSIAAVPTTITTSLARYANKGTLVIPTED